MLALGMAVMLASCTSESLTESDRTEAGFLDQVGGSISPQQWWRTAVTLNLEVSSDAPVQLWLMSGPDSGLLYDYAEVSSSSPVQLLAPQGQANTVYLVSLCRRMKHVQPVTLTGRAEEHVKVVLGQAPMGNWDFSQTAAAGTMSAWTDVQVKAASSLSGNSYMGSAQYGELKPAQLDEAFLILSEAYKEGVPAKQLGANCDYEFKSNGSFRITWFAGHTASARSHTLGYYYHSPGTYDDIRYVDISETELYDRIDGLAKVQYQVNGEAARKFGLQSDHWYDANFDLFDTFENAHPGPGREGDDVYNIMAVFDRYGRDISALRGISFPIDVPEGMCVGFYDRAEEFPRPEQYDRFVKMGIRPYTSREEFKTMNFSCEAMNLKLNDTYRSCVFKTDHALWLGMEDSDDGGDLDCNDVMFEVSADLEVHHPTVVEPDLQPSGEYDSIMPWTIAYEDLGRHADFDFNDAVIELRPRPEREECEVTLMAAGSTQKMYLHYDGPDGDVNLGEIHALLGRPTEAEVNTLTSVPDVPFAHLGSVKWPKGYTMEHDAHRFHVEVVRGTCTSCSDVITLPEAPGTQPEAMLVAGEWRWPKEGTPVWEAYAGFPAWSADNTRQEHWGWYVAPQAGTCVEHRDPRKE